MSRRRFSRESGGWNGTFDAGKIMSKILTVDAEPDGGGIWVIIDALAETPLFAKNQIFYAIISGR
jgi:hypothetical protein